MQKYQMTISELRNSNGSYSIWLNNVRIYQDIFYKINTIIRYFTDGKELYFGHYKIDGVNIPNIKFKQYSFEIPAYFKKYGQYLPIVENFKKNGKVYSRQELTVCRAPNTEETYKMLEKVFNYYLDTIIFSPKVDWDTFVHSYQSYMNGITKNYVLNGYTDFLFSYVDSEHFIITFNPELYEPQIIKEKIKKIVLNY